MFHKNHPTIPRVVPSYFKLNPDKKEKITNILSHTYPSDQIGVMLLFLQTYWGIFQENLLGIILLSLLINSRLPENSYRKEERYK